MAQRPMAPHRQRRILLLLAAFALQIPALIAMWIAGLSPDLAPMVCLLPAAALALCMWDRRRRP